jgi:hypothetical protein
MRNVSHKFVGRENQNTRLLLYFFFENRAVCKITWKNIVQRDRPRMTIWRMRIVFWIPKATDTISICTTAFARQQWLRERASMLRLYIHCLSCYTEAHEKK